ncbi:MAG: carbamoyltransferase HypF [Solirubrobacteraceae bacterium]
MSIAAVAPVVDRLRVRVEGTVQGVGFRPHVHRLARELALSGWVMNDRHGVLAEVEGSTHALDEFVRRVVSDAPPLARVERLLPERTVVQGDTSFEILASPTGGEADALVAPDAATCADCLGEQADPGDRRYRYPFVNCTNCGPRYTIVRGVPYDRPLTTMAGFEMCATCQAEYDDPADRRFHAQPNACPDCGPRALLLDARGDEVPGVTDAVAAAAVALGCGEIVAVKGLGGYHLACLASNATAVRALRARKHREDRPFALLVRDLAAARTLVELSPEAEALLTAPERPIVLAPRRCGARVAEAVAPGQPELGVMLPYTPLHHLLATDVGAPLVLTSANVSDEPIAYRDDDALERLGTIADLFLVHDRPIHTRVDDSVVRPGMILRRSRGHVPRPLRLPVPAGRHVLACGAELKSTFCLAREERAWLSHHIGDLKNVETLGSYGEGVELLQRLFAVAPEVVAHDLHPDYLSTGFALGREGVETVAVQHHHAHLAACLAEHGETGPAVGAIFDGAGLGDDGTVWGGELLAGDLRSFTRVGHLWAVRLPGGDRAARQPWRMACSWLAEAGGAAEGVPAALAGRVSPEAWHAVASMSQNGLGSPVTTSAGRLFDAAAALCGLRTEVTHEGQAAMELEAVCDPAERGAYEVPVDKGVLDARPLISAVAHDVHRGVPISVVATRFHHGLADATVAACVQAAADLGIGTAVLSGGAFQNQRLLARTAGRLRDAGLRVLTPTRVPPNDGGIAYGQAAIAVTRMAGA